MSYLRLNGVVPIPGGLFADVVMCSEQCDTAPYCQCEG